jgi:hypothetical protein
MKALVVVASLLLARTVYAETLDEKHLEQVLLDLPNTKLTQSLAAQLVTIAIDAAEADLDPFVLLAQIYVESRFDSTTTSRLVGTTRHTGPWASRRAPASWSGNLYCGIAQNAASTWTACLALRDPHAALAAQAIELRTWLQSTRGDLPRALAGYGCGLHGLKTGRCNHYPQRILALARRLRHAVDGIPLS